MKNVNLHSFFWNKKYHLCMIFLLSIFSSASLIGQSSNSLKSSSNKVEDNTRRNENNKDNCEVKTTSHTSKEEFIEGELVYKWYTSFFLHANHQRFIFLPELRDYAEPKPGYRAGGGFTFFHNKKNSFPIFIEGGEYNLTAGNRPLLRNLDVYPILINASYEFSPIKYFTLGLSGGVGVYITNIEHYPSVADMLINNPETKTSIDPVLNAGAILGANILEKSVEFRVRASAEFALDKNKLTPLPSLQLGVRFYPKELYDLSKRRHVTVITNTVKETIIEKIQLQKKPEKEVDDIYIYFSPESTKLDLNAKSNIKLAAEILRKNKNLHILFEGSSAPFGTHSARVNIEKARVAAVSEYLKNICDVGTDKIIYAEPFKHKNYKKTKQQNKEFYIQYRYVKIRFVKVDFTPFSGNVDENKQELETRDEEIDIRFVSDESNLDNNAKNYIKEAAEILKQYDDIVILFESSKNPFKARTVSKRKENLDKVENSRVINIAEHLKTKYGIDLSRIVYKEPPKIRKEKTKEEPEALYEYEKLRFIRINYSPSEHENIYLQTEGE